MMALVLSVASGAPATSIELATAMGVSELSGHESQLLLSPNNPTLHASYAAASSAAVWPVLQGPGLLEEASYEGDRLLFRTISLAPANRALTSDILRAALNRDPESREVPFLVTALILWGEHVDDLPVSPVVLEKASYAAARFRQREGRPILGWSKTRELENAYAANRWLGTALPAEVRTGLSSLVTETPGLLARLRAQRALDQRLSGVPSPPGPTEAGTPATLFASHWFSNAEPTLADSLRAQQRHGQEVVSSAEAGGSYLALHQSRPTVLRVPPLVVSQDPPTPIGEAQTTEPLPSRYAAEAKWRTWAVTHIVPSFPTLEASLTQNATRFTTYEAEPTVRDVRSIEPLRYMTDSVLCRATLGVAQFTVEVGSLDGSRLYTILVPIRRDIELPRLPSAQQFHGALTEGARLNDTVATLAP